MSGLHSGGMESPLEPRRYLITSLNSASSHQSSYCISANITVRGRLSSTLVFGNQTNQLLKILHTIFHRNNSTSPRILYSQRTLGNFCFRSRSLGTSLTTNDANFGVYILRFDTLQPCQTPLVYSTREIYTVDKLVS